MLLFSRNQTPFVIHTGTIYHFSIMLNGLTLLLQVDPEHDVDESDGGDRVLHFSQTMMAPEARDEDAFAIKDVSSVDIQSFYFALACVMREKQNREGHESLRVRSASEG